MINSVGVLTQTVAANSNVLFPTDRVRTRSCNSCSGWLEHDAGSGIFTLLRAGIYRISFNANITSETAGAISLVIENNGEAIGGTEMDYTVATAGNFHNVSASTLVQVSCGSSKSITIGNNSTLAELVKDANIIIEKIA